MSVSLDFDSDRFAYVAIGDDGNGVLAVYDSPPGNLKPGRLTFLLRDIQAYVPSIRIRCLVWLPIHKMSHALRRKLHVTQH